MYWLVFTVVTLLVVSLAANAGLIFRFVWTKPGRARQLAQNVCLSLASVAVVCLLAELFFKVGFAQSDGFNYTLAARNWLERYWHVNSLGYRDREWTPELLQGKTIVAVVGDSFVAGHGINDEANRFSNLLGDRLGPGYAVVNLGVNGADTGDEVENVQKYPYSPEIIIWSFYLNDIQATASRLGFKRPDLKTSGGPLVDNSYALNFLYWRLNRLQLAGWGNGYQDWAMGVYDNPEIWAAYQQELLDIVHLAKARNRPLVVVVFPNLQAVEASRPVTSRLVRLFSQEDVPVVDVAGLVEGMNPGDLVVNAVDAHPNERVHRLVADQLYQVIADHHWLAAR